LAHSLTEIIVVALKRLKPPCCFDALELDTAIKRFEIRRRPLGELT